MVAVLAVSTHNKFSHAQAGETVGWVLLGLACLGIWIALAHWPARVAQHKGYDYKRCLIFSLIFLPAAIVAAYLLPTREQPAH